jgi:hypothetical protein
VAAARAAGGEPERLQTALFLPPAIAGRLPHVEEWLARKARPLGGILGLALPGCATGHFAGRLHGAMDRSSPGVTTVSGSSGPSPLA